MAPLDSPALFLKQTQLLSTRYDQVCHCARSVIFYLCPFHASQHPLHHCTSKFHVTHPSRPSAGIIPFHKTPSAVPSITITQAGRGLSPSFSLSKISFPTAIALCTVYLEILIICFHMSLSFSVRRSNFPHFCPSTSIHLTSP